MNKPIVQIKYPGPTLVVSDSFYTAKSYAHEMDLRDWMYVEKPKDFFGRRGNKIAFVGEWWLSKALDKRSADEVCREFGFERIA